MTTNGIRVIPTGDAIYKDGGRRGLPKPKVATHQTKPLKPTAIEQAAAGGATGAKQPTKQPTKQAKTRNRSKRSPSRAGTGDSGGGDGGGSADPDPEPEPDDPFAGMPTG
jgi:hypothetical protein